MRGPRIVPAVLLTSLLCVHHSVCAQDRKNDQPGGAGSAVAAQQAARDLLTKLDKPGRTWKRDMECLVALAKAGPTAAPVLLDALKNGSADTREIVGQALVFLADGNVRPALEQAVEDKERDVRFYAIRSLGRLGRLEAKPRYRQIADMDPSPGVRFQMIFALARDDKPDPEALRKTLSSYDLTRMDSAHLGKAAPDFALTDTSGKIWRLSDLRGKKSVVLVFLIGAT